MLLEPEEDLFDQAGPDSGDVENVEDSYGFGELVMDRVRVTAEETQRGVLTPAVYPVPRVPEGTSIFSVVSFKRKGS